MLKKIKQQYDDLSRPLKASLWFVFVEIVNKGMSFVTTPLFTRIMSKQEYGTISIFNSWSLIISIVATLQLATGVFNKAMVKYEDDRDGYTSSSMGLIFISSICCYLIYCLICPVISKYIGLDFCLVTMMFADILLSSGMALWTIRERFDFNYRWIVIITLATNIIATCLSAFLTWHVSSNRVFGKVFGSLIVHVIVYSIIIMYIFRKGKKIYDIPYWKYSLSYNLPLIPHYLSQQVLNQSDRIMISNISGKADAAVYSLAYQLAIIIQIVTNAIHASFMPWTFQKLQEKQYKIIGKRALQIEILIGSCCALFSLFAPEFILILGGKEYMEAVYIVPPVSMSVLYMTIYSFFGNVEFYFEKTKLVMIASCIIAAINIGLNAIFIPLFGFVAAGYTTLVCYLLYSFIHYFFMKKICATNEIQNPYDGKKMLGISLVFTVISMIISFLYQFFVLRYLLIVIVFLGICIYIKHNKATIFGKN